jgi:hypothetical protein
LLGTFLFGSVASLLADREQIKKSSERSELRL